MPPWIVNDELWAVIEPLLLVKPAGTPGLAQHDPRLVFQGVLFVWFTGIGWEDLPHELEFGSGRTCWRRFGTGKLPVPSRRCTNRSWTTATPPG
ncbi:transposase [Nocardia coubleae]|uniref:Transposase n=1 Tax=Nocardia coubleae TaxID=356147 RepID=A0A846W5K6_9NOCA|nr:transposase [Nocardia coubleae]